jgi:sterol desaturase/sphingolipid hydroxylase (fatty acid hydroxylase superfamily)
MPIDADLFHQVYNKLWVYFVHNHLLGQPALILLGGLLMMTAECAFRKWEDTALYRLTVRRSVSAKVDIFSHLMQFLGLAFFLEVILTLGVSLGAARFATYVSNELHWARITLPASNIPEIIFSFFIYYFTDHFVGYWVHRLYHTKLFWHLHRFHHSAPELNYITFYRVHPAETFTRVLFFITPLTILNAPDKVLVLALVVNILLNYCQHSQMPKSWGWIGRWVFGSPGFHQLHHSIDAEHRDKNFSSCPLWDRVFGTWHDDRAVPSAYGISTAEGPDLRYDSQPVRQFLLDTLAFYQEGINGTAKLFRQATSWMRPRSNSDASIARTVATAGGTEERLGS